METERDGKTKPVAASSSSSTTCTTNAAGRLECVTLERTYKRNADGSVVIEERREPTPASRVDGSEVGPLLGGLLGGELLPAEPRPQGAGASVRAGEPLRGGQWM
mmetsp:Transcript_17299/g.40055  ORF Transcript_17299/g.40055 Transcript_17299/m.40055 type:complete len:105 (-) Transcript_17299:196-510(-)